MKDILFVDGYNIIHSWTNLHKIMHSVNLQAARDKLADIIGEYASLEGLRAYIVYDAHMVKGATNKVEECPGVTVVYTKEHQTADSYIEISVAKLDRYRQNIFVATSDATEQIVVLSQGATRISSRELYRLVSEKKHTEKSRQIEDKSTDIGSMLDFDTIAKLKDIK